jgi:hypothetical protein
MDRSLSSLLRVPLFLSCALLAACQFSTTGGESGLVNFAASECGAPLSGLPGCDLRRPLAAGGKVSVTATSRKTGSILPMAASDPKVLDLVPVGGGGYTLTGLSPGLVELRASDPTVSDLLRVQVSPIAQFAYSDLSAGNGTFTPTPGGEADGTFEVKSGLSRFTLILAQLDLGGAQLIGRESATYTLPAGLSLTGGQQPAGLQFEFQRPAPGSYLFGVRARTGLAGQAEAKIKIVVKD